MQGKFQLVLMPTAGHAIQVSCRTAAGDPLLHPVLLPTPATMCCTVQEDEPCKTAEYLQQFLHRFRIGEPPMVIPKARPGVRPVLPVVGGPLHAQPAQSTTDAMQH